MLGSVGSTTAVLDGDFRANSVCPMTGPMSSRLSPYWSLPLSLFTICIITYSYLTTIAQTAILISYTLQNPGNRCALKCSLSSTRHPSPEKALLLLVGLAGLLPSGFQSQSTPDLDAKICRPSLLDCPEYWLHHPTA